MIPASIYSNNSLNVLPLLSIIHLLQDPLNNNKLHLFSNREKCFFLHLVSNNNQTSLHNLLQNSYSNNLLHLVSFNNLPKKCFLEQEAAKIIKCINSSNKCKKIYINHLNNKCNGLKMEVASYTKLQKKFKIGKHTVKKICKL